MSASSLALFQDYMGKYYMSDGKGYKAFATRAELVEAVDNWTKNNFDNKKGSLAERLRQRPAKP